MNSFTSAVKSIAKKYNDTSLILRIAIGLVIGAVLALLCPGATWLEELGNLFVGALKGVAPVLVFVIVTSALAQGSSKLDRRFGTVVWLYMLTTFIAATLSVITSMLFPQNLVLAEAATADVIPQGLGDVLHTLLANIVSNPLSAIMNGNYIGILMWACLFGLAMKSIATDGTKKFLSDTSDAVSQIVRWVINLAPFGIMGLVFANVSDNGLSIFTQYGRLLLLLVGTMLLMALVINPLIIFIYLHRNPSVLHVAARLSDNFMPLMSSNWIAVLLISTFFTSSLKTDSSNNSSGGVLESFFWMSLVFCRIFSDVLDISFRESCCFLSLICCSMAALRSINCGSSI